MNIERYKQKVAELLFERGYKGEFQVIEGTIKGQRRNTMLVNLLDTDQSFSIVIDNNFKHNPIPATVKHLDALLKPEEKKVPKKTTAMKKKVGKKKTTKKKVTKKTTAMKKKVSRKKK